MTRALVVGLASFLLFGCELSLAAKHSCASDRDCLNGRVCEEQRCVDRAQREDGGEPIDSGSDDPGSEEDARSEDDAGSEDEPDAKPPPIEPVACDTSEDCPADQTCDTEQQLCAGCRVNADCRAGRVCDRELERCVACAGHGQCNDGSLAEIRACYAGACTPVECLADDQCASGGCDREFNTCWECIADGDCAAAEVCDTASHRCVACVRDSDCGAGWCSGDNQCVDAATCRLWDTFPPSTQLGHLVSTGDGFALADRYQVYVNKAQQWSLYRAAPATPDQPVITKLVTSREIVAAVLEDGTIWRGAQPPMVSIGQFDQIGAIGALDQRLWVATQDGKLRMHDGASWSDLPSPPAAVVGVGESTQGLVVFTDAQGYTLEGASYRPFAVPTGSFREVFTLPDGALFVRAGDRLYRLSGTQLVLDHPAACAKLAAIFNGARLLVRCQEGDAYSPQDAYYQRDPDGTWNRVAATPNGTEPSADGADVFLGGSIPRSPSGLPTRVAALGGRSGRALLIGGLGGVFRIGAGGFRAIPGTAHLDVGGLRERPDGSVISAVPSWSRLKPCKDASDCGPGGHGYECQRGFCGWGTNWGNCASTRSCEPGLHCFGGSESASCAPGVAVHETASGSDTTVFIGPSDRAGLDGARAVTGVHGGDDPGQLQYITFNDQQIFYRDAQGWHTDVIDSCMRNTGIVRFYTAFAEPDTLVTACFGIGVANLELNGIHEQVADTTSVVSDAPAFLAQLSDPPSVLLWNRGVAPRLRTASGYLPFDLPAEAEQRFLMSEMRPIGGTRDKVVAYEAKGTLSEFGYPSSAGWKTLTVPIPELELSSFWSTDGWTSVYAISRGGALLQCRLD